MNSDCVQNNPDSRNTMQDISRDEFGLLNGVCEKEIIIRSSSPNSSSPSPSSALVVVTTPSTSNNYSCSPNIPQRNISSPILDSVNVKLEDTDLYNNNSSITWHHPHHHHHHHHHHHSDLGNSKLLLQSSDDPLISSGANCDDDNPNELKSMIVAAATIAESVPDDLTSRDQNIIMTSQNLTNSHKKKSNSSPQARTRRKGAFKLRFHHQALPPEYLSHFEATQNQYSNQIVVNKNSSNNSHNNFKRNFEDKRLNDKQIKLEPNVNTGKYSLNSQENVRNWLQKISEMQEAAAVHEAKKIETFHIEENSNKNEVSSRQHKGRLDNVKSSIGVNKIVKYSDLPYMGEMTLENSKPRRGRKPKKTDICHLIYKNYGTIFPGTPKNLVNGQDIKETKPESNIQTKDSNKNLVLIEEPLNLCLRDQSESLTISSDENESDERSATTTPLVSPTDLVTDAFLAANLRMSMPSLPISDKITEENIINNPTLLTGDSEKASSTNGLWPNSFVNPINTYYQKVMDNGTLSSNSSQPSPVSPISLEKKSILSYPPKIVNTIKKEKMDSFEPCSTPNSIKSSSSVATGNSSLAPPQKRKRSAIFIPPMPAENANNPPTEVSICKFKFTGGAKPSLQEKKMLSVDSDGNYRYYSGTGDKASRGYEFFPRESLQQSGVVPGMNCSGAFLNALSETGEKISLDIPPPSDGLSNELLQIPDAPSALLSPVSKEHRKKKKTKRSSNREKLEQTFKDRGFLIQTQQLESAEGATYCKFRQLKKFTRYLFRSWKDYLPGDAQAAAAAAQAAVAAVNSSQTPQTTATINSLRNLIESNVNKSLAANASNNEILN